MVRAEIEMLQYHTLMLSEWTALLRRTPTADEVVPFLNRWGKLVKPVLISRFRVYDPFNASKIAAFVVQYHLPEMWASVIRRDDGVVWQEVLFWRESGSSWTDTASHQLEFVRVLLNSIARVGSNNVLCMEMDWIIDSTRGRRLKLDVGRRARSVSDLDSDSDSDSDSD